MRKIFKKWDILLVDLNPVIRSEMAKIRPCLIISPNSSNKALNTIIIVPFTTSIKDYPTRITTNHKSKRGSLAFDQIKTIDKSRIIKKDGELAVNLRESVNTLLYIMFSEE